jgi:hypothetical protein
MLTNIRAYFYKFRKYQSLLERFFFPAVLLLYPLVGTWAGVDIADSTYSLTNFRYLDTVDPMWAISTFLSNICGSLIMKLPGAGTMLGMNIYCSFVVSITALAAYYLLKEWMPGWMIFIGEFMAESLCWCPRVILYNYLTYLFFTLAVLLLLKGMFTWKRQAMYLALAGVCLGLNMMVRFPNVAETALILVLWFYLLITRDTFKSALQKTFICIGGFAAGVAVPFIGVSVIYGPGAYVQMIMSLFGMTEGASDYTAGGMAASIVSAYLSALKDMLIMIPCVAAGIIMFMMLKGRYILLKKLLYMAGLLVLVRYYFATGVFTRNYYYYDSMFKAAMMFVIMAIVFCIAGSLGVLNGSRQEQTLGFAALMVILITPLGSNNYTFPLINNLFVVAPIALWMMRRLMYRVGDADHHFPWQAMATMVIIVLVIQGALFHAGFAFGDGDDGTVRDAHSGVPRIASMVTTGDNARALDELSYALRERGLLDDRVILFGSVPGLSYIFDLEPAIESTWPDLDSFGTARFEDELMRVSAEGQEPTVIIGKEMAEYSNINEKYDILLDYIANHDYNMVFENSRFAVYAGGSESED